MKFQDIHYHMTLAIEEAEKAFKVDEVPVGAVIINENGKVVAKAHNNKEKNKDASGHAELLAMQAAAKELGDWRLDKCTLFVTLEPCPMCMAAMVQFRIKKVYFGAYDKKGGAASLGYFHYKDKNLNHNFSITGGIQHYRCSRILSQFFKAKRKFYSVH